jgi:hypothetical protein
MERETKEMRPNWKSNDSVLMICRHSPGDPNCSSNQGPYAASRELAAREQSLRDRTPSPENYEVIDAVEIGRHLVMKVKYPSCKNCSFDSKKVMVFMNTTMKQALFWKRIDPHFSTKNKGNKYEPPPPRARFPADDEGWKDAIKFAKSCTKT